MDKKRSLKDEDDYNSVDEDEPKIQKKNKGTAAPKPISKSKSRDDDDDDEDIPLYKDDDEEDEKPNKKKTSQSKDTKSKGKDEKAKNDKPRPSKNDRKKYTKDGDVEIEYIKDDEIMFHLQAKKKVVLSKFKNQVLISIREYFEKNGDILPTKKGVSLTKDGWDKLKACINDIDEQINNLS